MSTLGGLHSGDETAHCLRDNFDHWERYGYGIWVFRDRAEGRFMGRTGLQNTHVGGNYEVELAYALVAEYWNRGLATEMSRRSWSWLSSVSAWRT
jgi:RimJ/RimL family protein N-acetyltransferase